MVARVKTVAFLGLKVLPIDVQVQIAHGMPNFTVVGLPDKSIAESRERIRSALTAIGLALPAQRITVNLSPADQVKEGSHYDLPIVIGILCAMHVLPVEECQHYVALGEVALDGALVSTSGTLATALHCLESDLGLICPAPSGGEAAWAKGIEIIAPTDLLSLIHHFKGQHILSRPEPLLDNAPNEVACGDLSDVKGQEVAKRALLISAVGRHNLLLSGPPGSGKSMLAARLAQLLPPLAPQEALEVTMIHSLAGTLKEGRLMRTRPYRAPHHSCSQPALVGGGSRAKPGEISLAHHGVLFLDELPEFQRTALEALRQPLENGDITIARVHANVTYPAQFHLVAAMNPCRCGYLGNLKRQCSRAPLCGREYTNRLSGPLIDRFDVFVEVKPVDISQLETGPQAPRSVHTAQTIAHLQQIQLARQGVLNGHLTAAQMDIHALMSEEAKSLLQNAASQMDLSARGYQRVKRVARTLADMDDNPRIERHHVAEALSYRLI